MGYFCHALINKAVVKLSQDGRKKIVCNFSAAGGEDKGGNCKAGAYDLKKEEPLYPEDGMILIDEPSSDSQSECPSFSSEFYFP